MLNAGTAQIPVRRPEAEELAQIRRMSALHRRVALLELTKHEFLATGYRRERTTFADGTTVTVDWDAKTAAIQPDLP